MKGEDSFQPNTRFQDKQNEHSTTKNGQHICGVFFLVSRRILTYKQWPFFFNFFFNFLIFIFLKCLMNILGVKMNVEFNEDKLFFFFLQKHEGESVESPNISKSNHILIHLIHKI